MIIVITRPDFFEGEAEKIAQLLQSGRARVRVLSSHDKWYGVTYQQDRQTVQDALDQIFQ